MVFFLGTHLAEEWEHIVETILQFILRGRCWGMLELGKEFAQMHEAQGVVLGRYRVHAPPRANHLAHEIHAAITTKINNRMKSVTY